MNWLRKMRPALIVVGLALAVGSLVGARALTSGGPEAAARADSAPRSAAGTIVLGTVDTDPPPVPYGLPAVLQSGTVSMAWVRDGDAVKKDQELYAFDDTIPRSDVKRAEAALVTAKTKVAEAHDGKKRHAKTVETSEKAVKALENQAADVRGLMDLTKSNLERFYKDNGRPPEEWPGKLAIDPTYAEVRTRYSAAYNAWQIEAAKLDALKAVDTDIPIRQAEAAVEQANAELEKARAAVELCVVKARTAGTVEQVSISPGTTLGVGTRTPALWLLPAGPRVVRAEVEADFAHRVGPDKVGKKVTVTDHSDPKLTYHGTVRRIGDAFLLKRATAENFLGGDTRVIEAVIDITDPAPPGQPPLRVGQRVRVNLGP